MIPYFQIPPLRLGPLELHAFGALSALGIYVGALLAARAARKFAPGNDRMVVEAAPWLVVGGVVGGHLLHVLGYHPEILREEGWTSLLRLWEGQSSMGGLMGALITLLVFFRVRGARIRPQLNAFALGLAPGWAIARLGCFAAHDHPGVLTDFPLAVAFPGGARHDLGLYDAMVLGVLSLILYLLARKPRPEGLLMGVLAIGYAVPRFFLDFLRAQDLAFVDGRILGLTPAQYVCFVLVGIGSALVLHARGKEPVSAGSSDAGRIAAARP